MDYNQEIKRLKAQIEDSHTLILLEELTISSCWNRIIIMEKAMLEDNTKRAVTEN